MKIIGDTTNPKVVAVGCQHGNELIGQRVFDYYQSQIHQFPGLVVVVANEEAGQLKKRYVDQDLNRSYPGDPDGNHEQQLAYRIAQLVKSAEYVLDLHTTSSAITMTPIVTGGLDRLRPILNLTDPAEIAVLAPEIANVSLIGTAQACVALEFNEDYAKTEAAMDEVRRVIEGLLAGASRPQRRRKLFKISGTIARGEGGDAANFAFSERLGGYPFLLFEREYKDHDGFLATEVIETSI
jgi:hypothetical protein